ncbi:response regulator [Neorhizobium galegae]|uniref:response regulator n=1 Tax=Neorhizobium galegae TaxID=399 RepID=UPI0006229F00|nr:response regulator transcription factor [Neorhizobium galegae]CDZ56983.1 DNA-binding response regulator, OmpR family [Neorhizobium galegae bv. orientalis]KAB1123031.1 response regulator transcription factor [Neorhizobium galegae]MCQ1569970.1 response regulator transcription factor [Neorhizobium galegae]MCQ1807508.1 response regulator transcription factor [Neorhizobium galegae]MCQ1838079.1 response regulator transcription factor [Neorhizobium galegae]
MSAHLHLVAPETGSRILLVEDDHEIASMVVEMLSEHNFDATAVGSAADMDVMMRNQSFDLIVLDAMLPGEDGFSICRRLRATSVTPIIMLTAVKDDIDRIIGIELGADDYITKPFNPRELMARIKGLLRRASYGTGQRLSQTPMEFAGWLIDPVPRQLISPDGVHVSMTTAEFDVLMAFCRNPGRVLTREQLLGLTHAGLAGPVERSVDVHVSRVRQKIEPNVREPTFIKTVRLGGYLFTPKVENR